MADRPDPLVPDEAHQFAPAPQPVTIDYAPRHIVMYHLTKGDIDDIAAGGDFVNLLLAFFGISVGSLVSLGGILLTTPVDSSKKYAVIVSLAVLSLVGSLVFGILGCVVYTGQKKRIADIKRSPISQ
jgi:hypothetical protein